MLLHTGHKLATLTRLSITCNKDKEYEHNYILGWLIKAGLNFDNFSMSDSVGSFFQLA